MSYNIKHKNLLVVGVGPIAQEYVKILGDLGCAFTVVGRGKENAVNFERQTGISTIAGGVDSFFSSNALKFDAAIVAVGIESLASVTSCLLANGIKNILLEKPGANHLNEISTLADLTKQQNAQVLLAYNRRFYASVLHAKKIINEDGGVSSFNFEFTEWGHEIEKLPQSKEIKNNWLMANSSHVIDMAFYMGGFPEQMSCYSKDELSWHKPINFSGAGISQNKALFSYQANWDAPGRWGVEIITKKHRLIFRPLEKLQIQKKGSIEINYVEIDNTLDVKYKPGFYKQVVAFLSEDYGDFCTIVDQQNNIQKVYNKILGIHD